MTASPLAGIKVVEFTHMVMGPAVGHILASLGADVTRIEPLGGDQTRTLKGSGAGYFPMYNRHKRSICLDFKSEAGIDVARDLATDADVLIMMGGERPGRDATLPLAGADAHAVLSDLGYSEERIEAMINAGAAE